MGTTVSSGVTATISTSVSGLVVASGGALLVSSGGIALSATVDPGGSLTVLSGGLDSGSLVQSGGSETVLGGGSAVATTDDAILTVAAGGVASGVKVGIGTGTLDVTSGGIAIAPIVSSYYTMTGTVIVDSGGVLSGGGNFVTLEAGGSLAPGGSGTFSGLVVTSGATADITSGLSAMNATVDAGGSVVVGPGGYFEGQIAAGAFVAIEGGGARGIAGNGGTLVIGAGGVDLFQGLASVDLTGNSALIVQSGGTVEVEDRFLLEGTVNATAGGVVLVTYYGSAGPLVLPAGKLEVTSTAVVSSAVAGQGALIEIGSGATAVNVGVSGGTLIVDAGAVLSGGLVFDQYGYGGEMVISGTTLPTVPVSGLGRDETIDLPSIPFDPAGTISAGTSAITFVENGYGYSLPIVSAGLIGQTVLLARDASGGTMIEVPCFAAGTRIAAPAGEVPVETLRPGDLVLTLGGAARRVRPVRWVGTVAVDLTRHPAPQKAAPIRIRAGAFADCVPARDLLVSPDHALLVDGVLIQAQALVNGATIVQEFPARVVYWHVELDEHAILLVEGLPAESYRDTGNRAVFAGESGVRALHPDFAAPAAALVLGGPLPRAAHGRLVLHALSLGHRVTADADLAVLGPQQLASRGAGRWLVPAGTRQVRLASRSFVPAWYGEDDRRRLGVAVRRVLLDGHPLPDAAFGLGWNEAEGAWRWTDGAADLHLPPLPRAATLAIELTERGGRYWLSAAAGAAAHVA